MPTPVSRTWWSREPAWTDIARRCMSALLIVFVMACGGVSDLLTPGVRDTALPAHVAVSASVAASVGTASADVALVVASEYTRRDGRRIALGSQTIALSGSASQAVALSIDLGKCLGDDARESSGGRDRSCTVFLKLGLQVNGVEVDRQVIGPLRLSPGGRAGVDQPVSLYDISAIEVRVPGGGVVGMADTVRVEQGRSLSLVATIRDRSGRMVTERAVTWTSATPATASVSATDGTVTALTVGDARIVATIGTLIREVSVRVLRTPSVLRVVAGEGSGRGTIRSAPAGIDCRISDGATSGQCEFTFPGEALVTLSSTPDAGSAALRWGEECSSAQPAGSCVVDMARPRVVAASYTALRRVTVAPFGGDGAGRVTGPAGLDCRLAAQASSGVCSVDVVDGAAVVLVATPDTGTAAGAASHVLVNWGGVCAQASGDTCRVVATEARGATVRFAAPRTVRVMLEGSGQGRVIGGAGIIDCLREGGASTGRCAGEGAFGSAVTLTALADSRAMFSGWVGGCDAVEGARCVVTLAQSRTVTATFVARRRVVVAADGGDGAGRVTSSSGIDCRLSAGVASGRCELEVNDGTPISLVAHAETGTPTRQTFVGWGGECAAAAGATCVVAAGKEVTTVLARFADEQRLHVVLEGAGAGRVIAVLGVACVRANGATTGACDATGPFGTTVTLTAIPDPVSTFAGWSGACAAAPGTTCITTLDQARTVHAIFKRKQAILTVTATGPVSGSVLVNGQSACSLVAPQQSVTCSLSLDAGTLVSVLGIPSTGARLAGYSGACSGSGACQTVMSEARDVTVQFDRVRPTLNVQLTGAGSGSVAVGGTTFCSLAPGQGSNSCSGTFAYGAVVHVTGVAAAGASFAGFTGDCSGTGSCTLTLTRDMHMGAQFSLPPVTLTVAAFGRGAGRVVGGGALNCSRSNGVSSGVCTETVPYGTTITLSAVAEPGSRLEIWNGACAGATGTTCTLRLTGNASAGAGFTRTP